MHSVAYLEVSFVPGLVGYKDTQHRLQHYSYICRRYPAPVKLFQIDDWKGTTNVAEVHPSTPYAAGIYMRYAPRSQAFG